MNQLIKTDDTMLLNGVAHELMEGHLGFLGSTSSGQKLREEFSYLAYSPLSPYLSDIGDVKTTDPEKTCSILKELYATGSPIVHLFTHQGNDKIPSSYWESCINPVLVSSRPLPEQNGVAQLGLQKHFFSKNFDYDSRKHLRLSDLRSHKERAEVVLRTADCIVIDLNVLRYADNLGSIESCTAGLHIEELCMIAKYAGASSNLRTIIIKGYDQNKDIYRVMVKNVALLLYYIIDGYAIGQRDKNQTEQLQRYSVLPDLSSQEVVFVEDLRSGRWWIELYSEAAGEIVKMPCTKKDYEDACDNNISDRLTSLLTLP